MKFWLEFVCFRVFFRRLFFGENGLWGRKQTLNLKYFCGIALFNYVKRLFFFLKNKLIGYLGLSDSAKVGTATLVVLELLLFREVAVTDVAVRCSLLQTGAVDVPARLHVIRKS